MTGLKQDEPQSGPAIVRKVNTNETAEELPKKDVIEVSDSRSNEEAVDESQEIQEPSDDKAAKLDTSEEDNKEEGRGIIMSAISASQVKELREKTGLGLMDCKVLEEANGDIDLAIDELRKPAALKQVKSQVGQLMV